MAAGHFLEVDQMSISSVGVGVEGAESRVNVSNPNEGCSEVQQTRGSVKKQIYDASNCEADQARKGTLRKKEAIPRWDT